MLAKNCIVFLGSGGGGVYAFSLTHHFICSRMYKADTFPCSVHSEKIISKLLLCFHARYTDTIPHE